jgi:hypothetical protein
MTNEIVFCDKKVSKLFIIEIYEEFPAERILHQEEGETNFVTQSSTEKCYFVPLYTHSIDCFRSFLKFGFSNVGAS